MPKNTNAQFAIEFIVLISFMFFIFLGILAVITSKVLEAKEAEVESITEDISKMVSKEVDVARPLSNGYTNTFSLPDKINGNDYGIQIIQDREIVVTYLGKEYVTFLPENVKVNPVKNIAKGQNKINKIDGIVYLNYDFECSDEADNDGDSAVDMDDTGCLTLTDNNEIN